MKAALKESSLLVAILALSFAMRWPFRGVFLNRDEGEYAYLGQQILQGAVPYADVYNQKTPFVFYLMAFIQKVAGPSMPSLRLATTLYGLVTTVALYLLARRLFGRGAALVAGLAFSLMTFDQCGIGYSASTEFFMLLWIVLALHFWYAGRERRRAWPVFVAGVAAGIAYLTKQSGLVVMLFFGAERVWSWIRDRASRELFGVLRDGVLVSLGFAAILGITLAYFAWRGALHEYLACTWTRNWQYVEKRHGSLEPYLLLAKWLFTNILRQDLGFWLLGSAGLAMLAVFGSPEKGVGSSRTDEKTAESDGPKLPTTFSRQSGSGLWILLLGCAGFAFLSSALNRHYWEPLIVPLALGVGVAMTWLARQLARPQLSPWLRLTLVVAVAAPWVNPALYQASCLKMTEVEIGRLNESFAFPGARQAAQYLADHTSPEEPILIIGSEPQIYYYAKRKACTRLVITYPMTGPYTYAAALRQEFLGDFERHRPRYVLLVPRSGSLADKPDWVAVLDPILNRLYNEYTEEWRFGFGPSMQSVVFMKVYRSKDR